MMYWELLWGLFNLVVPQIDIHETYYFVALIFVNHVIYIIEEIRILGLVKSMHIHHLFDAFHTKTTLSSYEGYLVSIIKPTLVSL